MRPYYEDDAVTIYHGDCRELLPSVKFDFAVTDPPYGVGKTYGSSYVDAGGDEYWSWLQSIVDALSDSGRPVVMTHRVLALRHLTGWDWVGAWVKLNEPQMRLFSMPVLPTWEPILCWGIKGLPVAHRMDTFDRRPKQPGSCGHPFPKPIELMWDLIKWLDPVGDQVVLDPFAGSGTTLRAAKDLGRKAIGIELEERYCEIAAKRLAQEVLPL